MKKFKMNLKISLIILVGIVVLTYLLWIIVLRKNFDYTARYRQKDATFSGDFQGYLLEYNDFTIYLADFEYNNPVPLNFIDSDFAVKFNGKVYSHKVLKPSDLKPIGAAPDDPNAKDQFWFLRSGPGVNPPFTFSCHFYDNKLTLLSFHTKNPPYRQSLQECPLEFSFNGKDFFKFPITKKEVDKMIGKPEDVDKYFKFP